MMSTIMQLELNSTQLPNLGSHQTRADSSSSHVGHLKKPLQRSRSCNSCYKPVEIWLNWADNGYNAVMPLAGRYNGIPIWQQCCNSVGMLGPVC